MKRYWKFITLCVSTLLLLGGFYLKTSAERNKGYEIKIKDISGDRTVLKDLVIEGDFTDPETYSYDGFKLRENSITYRDDLSYLKALDGEFNKSPRIQHYTKEYRSFMRGKQTHSIYFAEDDQFIAYAADQSNYDQGNFKQELLISRINKDTKKVDEFAFSLPENEYESSYYVVDNYYDDNKLHTITQRTNYSNNTRKDTYFLSIWNFDTQKMDTENKVIEFLPDEKYKEIELVETAPSESNLNYAAFIVTSGESFSDYSDLQGELTTHVFTFDYETSDIKEVKNETSVPFSINTSGMRTAKNLYVYMNQQYSPLLKVDVTKEALIAEELIKGTPIQIEKTDESDEIDEEYVDSEENLTTITVHDQKMYTVDYIQSARKPAILTVVDVQTGKELYKGTFELNNGKKVPMNYELYFQAMHFD